VGNYKRRLTKETKRKGEGGVLEFSTGPPSGKFRGTSNKEKRELKKKKIQTGKKETKKKGGKRGNCRGRGNSSSKKGMWGTKEFQGETTGNVYKGLEKNGAS